VNERNDTTEVRIAICVCTFRRPEQLGRLLNAFIRMVRPASSVFVIVDNDGQDPQVREQVDKFRNLSGAGVEYVIEQTPGISAARNTAIATARHLDAAMVAMLDDDEQPSPDWLAKLLEARHATGAGVVGGPVKPVFDSDSGKLEKYERLWSLGRGFLNGRVYVCATCNCLIDLSAIAVLGDRPFPAEFGLTGGEDSVFFRKLFFAGIKMAWAEEAVVYEEIAASRASIGWMRRRWYRHGNAGVRAELAAPDPNGLQPLLKTLLLCVRLAVYPLFNREALTKPLFWLLESDRIRGRMASHFGRVFAEYERPETLSPAANMIRPGERMSSVMGRVYGLLTLKGRRRKLARRLAGIFRFRLDHTIRVVCIDEWIRYLNTLPLSTLSALEISPENVSHWRKLGFGSYTAVEYPGFDITRDVLNRKFDVIIADNVFEHLRDPYQAARNVLAMLSDAGVFMLATPFLVRVHRVPSDFTRWTPEGLQALLEDCGFEAEVRSWGNRSAVQANLLRWRSYGWGLRASLRNEPDVPATVWAYARKRGTAPVGKIPE
jgi:succinoglycan biosynthesis protein ExoM